MFSSQDVSQIAAEIAARISGGAGDPLGINSRTRDAFFITVESTLAPLATDVQRFTLDTDADFLVTTMVQDVRDNALPGTRVADPAIAISIQQSQSARGLQNIALPLVSIAGTGAQHDDWPAPKFLGAGTTISVSQTSLLAGGGITYRSRVTFWGFKIYR